MKRLFTLVLVIFPLVLKGQTIEKYSGTYRTNLSEAGEANYSFKKSDKGREIKHGALKYTLREAKDISKLSQDIAGNYTEGLKSGVWSFRAVLRDYPLLKPDEYLTGSVTLQAAYDKGVPTGRWWYTLSVKSRKVISNSGGRIKWGKFEPERTVDIQFTIRDGMLVDSVVATIANQQRIMGVLDNRGFYDGEWFYDNGTSLSKYRFEHGFLVSATSEDKKSQANLLEQNQKELYDSKIAPYLEKINQNPSARENYHFTLDSICLLETTRIPAARFIKSEITDNVLLPFRSFDGETIGLTDLKGMCELTEGNYITRVQKDKIKQYNRPFKSCK